MVFCWKKSRLIGAALLLGVCVPAALAQRSGRGAAEEPSDRLSLGFRAGAALTRLVKNAESVESDSSTDPPTTASSLTESVSSRWTAGATVRFEVTQRIGVGVDVLYRQAGYDTGVSVFEQITDDDDDGDLVVGLTEETRADAWDFPILGRYYFQRRSESNARPFVTGGIAFRAMTGLSTVSEITDEEGVTDTDREPIGPENDFIQGAVLGTGIQLRDNVGLKVELEVRLTRWFQRSLQSGPANSNQNQLEFAFGLTF